MSWWQMIAQRAAASSQLHRGISVASSAARYWTIRSPTLKTSADQTGGVDRSRRRTYLVFRPAAGSMSPARAAGQPQDRGRQISVASICARIDYVSGLYLQEVLERKQRTVIEQPLAQVLANEDVRKEFTMLVEH